MREGARFEFRPKAAHKEVAIRLYMPLRYRLQLLFGFPVVVDGESDYHGDHFKFRIDLQAKELDPPDA